MTAKRSNVAGVKREKSAGVKRENFLKAKILLLIIRCVIVVIK